MTAVDKLIKREEDNPTVGIIICKEVKTFIKTNQRNPSKHRIEEHDMLNWLKANRKRMNAGLLQEERLKMFKELLELMVQYKHVNQYQ